MVRKIAKGAAVVAAILAVIFIRAFYDQYREFNKGEAAYGQNNYRDAAVYYETALHMYTPGSPYVRRSIDRMIEIGRSFEARNELRWALYTYEDLRSSLYAAKSFYLPYPEIIAFCDGKIAELAPKVRK